MDIGEHIMGTKQDRRDFLKLGATVGSGVVLGGVGLTANGETNPKQTDDLTIFDVFKNRRSVRKFKSTPFPEDHITKILDAAHLAPTGGNAQQWKFLVIRNRNKLDHLRNECVPYVLNFVKKRKDFDPNSLDAEAEELKAYFENYL